MQVAKKIDLNGSHHKKKIVTMYSVNKTYCDGFTIYKTIKSLCCTPEVNIYYIMLCQLYGNENKYLNMTK